MYPESLPERLDLEQFDRKAKELWEAARADDGAALERIRVQAPEHDPALLDIARLVIARESGYADWPELTSSIETAMQELAQRVESFLAASVSPATIDQAAQILADDPDIATYDLRTAVVLGDAARVRDLLVDDRALAAQPAPGLAGCPCTECACRTGIAWTQPERPEWQRSRNCCLRRAPTPDAAAHRRGDRQYCTPLFAAAGCADNPSITELLLEEGAYADDDTVYLAAFHNGHECLQLLLQYSNLPSESTALVAPISIGDIDGARLLLDVGAVPTVHSPAICSVSSIPPNRRSTPWSQRSSSTVPLR